MFKKKKTIIKRYCTFHREPLRPGNGVSKWGHQRDDEKKQNSRLDCLLFVCVSIYFMSYYKSFARTDVATNQMQYSLDNFQHGE